MKSVAMLLFPNTLMLDVAGPLDVFSVANRYINPSDHYQITTISAEAIPLPTSNGVALVAQKTFDDAPMIFDYLLTPGGPGAYNDSNSKLVSWLAEAAPQAELYGSICTGAFLLGKAGLLDDYRVTTHWNYRERLTAAFPKAIVETDQVVLRDRKLITSGGVTAGIDLALSIVADDFGKCVALDVAKVLLVSMRRQDEQSQFSPLAKSGIDVSAPIMEVQEYIVKNIEANLNSGLLAQIASMSTRNFTRVFTREMGVSPAEFVQNVRVDRARCLLETSRIPVKTVAYKSGFGCERRMRDLFNQKLNITPSEYRKKFG
jgi:transcriptional regulator GlxA family with amidase domain